MTFKAPLDLTVHRPEGMYDPSQEHDACGVGMVTTLNKRPERKIVDDAIEVLVNLNHRGAVGAEENTGDGAGILRKGITPRASHSSTVTSRPPASRNRPSPAS